MKRVKPALLVAASAFGLVGQKPFGHVLVFQGIGGASVAPNDVLNPQRFQCRLRLRCRDMFLG